MAQKVQVMLVCDLHDEDDAVEGSETVNFALDGYSYEIDVCEDHAVELRDALAPYVGAGRRAGRSTGGSRGTARSTSRTGQRTAARPTPDTVSSADVSDIREWARAQGHQVSDRGRLSAAVLEAYEAAH